MTVDLGRDHIQHSKLIKDLEMIREIIKIDEELCNGCGLCIPSCPEGALQLIDGKARLISDLMCDGLGACIGDCPEGAITIEKREAEPYNETIVMGEIVKHGKNTVIAHLKHLLDHNEMSFYDEAVEFLEKGRSNLAFSVDEVLEQVYAPVMAGDNCATGGCPGARMVEFDIDMEEVDAAGKSSGSFEDAPSELRQWPVQMHLVNPNAPYFQNADVVLAADCVAFTAGNFHSRFLKGHTLAIACPKLDQGKEMYIEKLRSMIDDAKINTLHVIVMEVPCCSGLVHIARLARDQASRNVPLKQTVVSIQGQVLAEEWL